MRICKIFALLASSHITAACPGDFWIIKGLLGARILPAGGTDVRGRAECCPGTAIGNLFACADFPVTVIHGDFALSGNPVDLKLTKCRLFGIMFFIIDFLFVYSVVLSYICRKYFCYRN